MADEAVDLAERNGWMRRSASAAAHCALGVCAYHRNSMTQAGHFLDLAEEAARASRERTVAVAAGVTRTRLALLRGDPDAAEAALRDVRDDTNDWETPLRLAGALSIAQAEAMLALSAQADTEFDPTIVDAALHVVADEAGFSRDPDFQPKLHRMPLPRTLRRGALPTMMPRLVDASLN